MCVYMRLYNSSRFTERDDRDGRSLHLNLFQPDFDCDRAKFLLRRCSTRIVRRTVTYRVTQDMEHRFDHGSGVWIIHKFYKDSA